MLKPIRKINPQKTKLHKNHNLSTSIAFNNKYIAQIIDQNSIELNEYIQAGRNVPLEIAFLFWYYRGF